MINKDMLQWGLEELASEKEQERLWLGNAEGEMSSFEEAVCNTFDDSGLSKTLESKTASANYPSEFTKLVGKLSQAIGRIDANSITPRELIDSDALVEVRECASRVIVFITANGSIFDTDC